MQSRGNTLNKVFMIFTCVILGLIALLGQILFLAVFVPIAVYVIWTGSRKVSDLQRRVAELEGTRPKESGQQIARPDDSHGEA